MVSEALCREQQEELVEHVDSVGLLAGAKWGCATSGEDTWEVPGDPWGILESLAVLSTMSRMESI